MRGIPALAVIAKLSTGRTLNRVNRCLEEASFPRQKVWTESGETS